MNYWNKYIFDKVYNPQNSYSSEVLTFWYCICCMISFKGIRHISEVNKYIHGWYKCEMKENLERCIRLPTRKCVNSSIVMAKMQIDPFCGPIGQFGGLKF